ncbi:hypothetical protein T08_10805 [Trichinella sp. T8]|nr:hypothetical protein T08_10805 [Trichinella sp. T8]
MTRTLQRTRTELMRSFLQKMKTKTPKLQLPGVCSCLYRRRPLFPIV